MPEHVAKIAIKVCKSAYALLLSNKQYHFYNKLMWQYVHPVSVLGFEHTTSWTSVFSHNNQTRAPALLLTLPRHIKEVIYFLKKKSSRSPFAVGCRHRSFAFNVYWICLKLNPLAFGFLCNSSRKREA